MSYYLIGKIGGINISAETKSTTDANACMAIFSTAMEMRWRPASEIPPVSPDAPSFHLHSNPIIIESPDWSHTVIGRYVHGNGSFVVGGQTILSSVTRWMPLPKKMPSDKEIQEITSNPAAHPDIK